MQILKENLNMARERMKIQADKTITERRFEVGDWVYLRLQPYHQKLVNNKRNCKLAPYFYGPFQVE